jgi:hypothetical protein
MHSNPTPQSLLIITIIIILFMESRSATIMQATKGRRKIAPTHF